MTDPTPAPVPVIPSQWTPVTIATLIGAGALFILSTLTQAGVTVPSHVSSEVQVVVGAIGQLATIATGLIALVSHNSVAKAALKASAAA